MKSIDANADRRHPHVVERRGGSVYLEVTLINGQNFSIPVEADNSLEQELELFLNRGGRYRSDWVPLQKSGRELFVRYDQIVLVSPKT